MKYITILLISVFLVGCVSSERVSTDPAYNYAIIFKDMQSPMPAVVNSRLERYTKKLFVGSGHERNGEWEFELIASQAWVDEVKRGFMATSFTDISRRPTVSWWLPDADHFDAFHMPYSSYSSAHLYIERNPSSSDRIHVFIQRH